MVWVADYKISLFSFVWSCRQTLPFLFWWLKDILSFFHLFPAGTWRIDVRTTSVRRPVPAGFRHGYNLSQPSYTCSAKVRNGSYQTFSVRHWSVRFNMRYFLICCFLVQILTYNISILPECKIVWSTKVTSKFYSFAERHCLGSGPCISSLLLIDINTLLNWTWHLSMKSYRKWRYNEQKNSSHFKFMSVKHSELGGLSIFFSISERARFQRERKETGVYLYLWNSNKQNISHIQTWSH